MARPRILVVEHDPILRRWLEVHLSREGYLAETEERFQEADGILENSRPDLVIIDGELACGRFLDLLNAQAAATPELGVIVLDAPGSTTVRGAAYESIPKPVNSGRLSTLLHRILDSRRSSRPAAPARPFTRPEGFEQIIGSSRSLIDVLNTAARVAPTEATVLITGETGTGKELLARAIHAQSPRRGKPLVIVNCAAVPHELLESELFGHMRGSFTGAMADRKGKVEAADGGTLLLDEIGDMPADLQSRILRLIQEGEAEKVGATSSVKVDVRIIASTHRDLAALVAKHAFREDLYYRLLVVPLVMPALRDRIDDIPELIRNFLAEQKAKYSRPELACSPDLTPSFLQYPWPGNIRQLENTIERLVLLSNGPQITFGDLPAFLQSSSLTDRGIRPVTPEKPAIAETEKQAIVRALRMFGGNQTRAARHLDMSLRALSYRLKKYRLLTDLAEIRK
jgi:two-component system NtrC family response regulator